jgi:3',5'-cyclic AMP phosphodiesterase CpdA
MKLSIWTHREGEASEGSDAGILRKVGLLALVLIVLADGWAIWRLTHRHVSNPASSVIQGAPIVVITKGPYIQNLGRHSVTVMWETKTPSASKLEYNTINSRESVIADARPVSIHAITINSLMPGTRYNYHVEGDARGGGTFVSAPDRPRSFRFDVYGDTRDNPRIHAEIIQAMLTDSEGRPDFVVHTGDLVGDGIDVSQWGPQFFKPAQPLMSDIPLWPCLGNHERQSRYYFPLFSLPNNKQWYSFDYSFAHVIVLNTNTDFKPGSEQYNWLVKDLHEDKSRWTFVAFHNPPFSDGPHGNETESRQAAKYLVPLFEKHKVDAVFSGHDHAYERGTRNGIVYIVTAGGGAPLYARKASYTSVITKYMKVHHYCTVDVGAQELVIQAKGVDGTLIDMVRVTK